MWECGKRDELTIHQTARMMLEMLMGGGEGGGGGGEKTETREHAIQSRLQKVLQKVNLSMRTESTWFTFSGWLGGQGQEGSGRGRRNLLRLQES